MLLSPRYGTVGLFRDAYFFSFVLGPVVGLHRGMPTPPWSSEPQVCGNFFLAAVGLRCSHLSFWRSLGYGAAHDGEAFSSSQATVSWRTSGYRQLILCGSSWRSSPSCRTSPGAMERKGFEPAKTTVKRFPARADTLTYATLASSILSSSKSAFCSPEMSAACRCCPGNRRWLSGSLPAQGTRGCCSPVRPSASKRSSLPWRYQRAVRSFPSTAMPTSFNLSPKTADVYCAPGPVLHRGGLLSAWPSGRA